MAERLTLVVVGLQALLLTVLTLVPGDPPWVQFTWLELFWAARRRPTFYPLLAVLTVAPALTLVAVAVPGRHRAWLALSWCAFSLALMILFGRRIAVMLDVLWWQMR